MKVLISAVMIMALLTPSFVFAADDNFNKPVLTEKQIRQELKALGYEVLYVTKSNEPADSNASTNSKENSADQKLYFEDLDQFILFDQQLFSLKTADNNSAYKDDALSAQGQVNPAITSSTINGVGHVSKYSPFLALNGIFCWKNIDFKFKASYYELAGYYTAVKNSVSSISSYLSGLIGVEWYQTAATYNTNDPTGLTVKFTISGYYLFGVKIGDYNVGVKKSDKWNITSDDINEYL